VTIWGSILAGLGGTAVLAFLVKLLAKHLLSKDLDEHRNRLTKELESHRTRLQSESALEIEKLRSALQITAHEQAIRFTQLHEKRSAIIAEAFKLLVPLYQIVMELHSPLGADWQQKVDVRWAEAKSSFLKFCDFFDQNRLYFSCETCGHIDEFLKKASAMLLDWKICFQSLVAPDKQTYTEWKSKWKAELHLLKEVRRD
jgi:hypothetical protein